MTSCVIDRDARLAATCGRDHTVRVWDLERMEPLATFTADWPTLTCAISTTADGPTQIVATDQSGTAHRLELVQPTGPR